MLNWREFSIQNPDIAAATTRLLARNEVAFIATVSSDAKPRMHPFVPKIVANRLVAFIMDSSPKINDLRIRHCYAIHTLPGDEDEQLFLAGDASYCDDETAFRNRAATAMGFATGVDQHHILYEFKLDRALWTTWIDFGTQSHRPEHRRWTFKKNNQEG